MNIESRELPKINCPIIKSEPTMTPELFDKMTTGADSIVVITYAAGGVPEKLIPNIKSKVDSGIPVFLISDNVADEHGILGLKKYTVHQPLAQSGATPIEKINLKDIEQLMSAIQEQTFQGKTGIQLAEAIGNQYKFKKGEAPIPKNEDPKELDKMQDRGSEILKNIKNTKKQ